MKVFDKKVPKQGQKSWSDPALLKPEDSSVESSAKLVKKREHAPHSDWRQRRDAAIRRYHQLGLCPIPLKGKRPYQKGWQAQEQYQELSAEAILQRFGPSDNVGLLLGISWRQRGLFLRGIDYDDLDLWEEHMACAGDQEGYGWLLSGPMVRTGNDNSHHYILSDSSEKFVFQGKESTEHGGEIQGAGTQLAELELGQQQVQLVKREEIIAAVQSSLLKIKTRLLAIPTKLGHALANELNAASAKNILETEICAALSELSLMYQPKRKQR